MNKPIVAYALEDYLKAELDRMSHEIGIACPGASMRDNQAVISWIEKNAARFRDEWEHRQVHDSLHGMSVGCSKPGLAPVERKPLP